MIPVAASAQRPGKLPTITASDLPVQEGLDGS
jgi:hypothetical protein